MIRSARTRNRRLGRLFRMLKTAGPEIVLSQRQFRRELDKEIYRSDRRESGRDLGLIRLQLDAGGSLNELVESKEFSAVLDRLRITDSVGWYGDRLAFLLPECSSQASLVVAEQITDTFKETAWRVSAEVSSYPFDDILISSSQEVQRMDRRDDDSDDDYGSGSYGATRRDRSHGVPRPKGRGFRVSSELAGGGTKNAVGARTEVLDGPSGEDVVVARREKQVNQQSTVMTSSAIQTARHRFVRSAPTPWWKRGIDIVGAGAGLVLLSPALVAAAVAIKVTSEGPVFFRQAREGKDGREFKILKFRTMVVNAEALQKDLLEQSEQDGPAFKLTDDPRVTQVGKYLRKSCIDELPQLWNVLTGEMSLVGPRPLPVHESLACTAWQRARLTVLPGLTCTWQAYGGRDVKFAQWMQMDLDYIERQSLLFDLKLIFDTACKALLHRGSV